MPRRIALLVLLLVSLPFLSALLAAGSEYQFGGFLLNPIDGNSYLAKMYQGWRGDWRFTLPFSADPGEGAYLYTFYLLLGHLARLAALPLIGVFHASRLLSAAFLLWALWRFLKLLHRNNRHISLLFTLASLGLGMGWLVFPAGVVTSDFWVAEAYTFLSAYTTPHFALSLALLIWMLTFELPVEEEKNRSLIRIWGRLLVMALSSIALASLSPFALALGLEVLGILLVWHIIEAWISVRPAADSGAQSFVRLLRSDGDFRQVLLRFSIMFISGGPVLFYELWAVRADPILAAWNSQNLTPAPPLWDLLLAFSPALVLSFIGGWYVLRREVRPGRISFIWALISLVMVILPFGLQRRFLIGLSVPLVALAGFGLEWLEERRFRFINATVVLALALPSLALVLLVGQFGAWSRDPLLYLTRGEAQGLEWLEANTDLHALVLASPQTGLFIPAHTGRRVLYGHPFETVNAQAEKAAVTDFFARLALDPAAARGFLSEREVDVVFYGPRERLLGPPPDTAGSGLELAYSSSGVSIYEFSVP